ncbi:MAG TPA: magnesium transporter CorA family protein [bacterium]|nr:magnesium transporter CorA family protein [bacterium]
MHKAYTIFQNHIIEAETMEAGSILVFINPDDLEKHLLVDQFKIDEHTLHSSLDPDELSRLEFEPNHLAIIYKRPKSYSGKEKLLFRVSSAGLFLFQDKLVILLSEDIPLFDGKQFSRVSSLPDVLLRLVYRSVFHFLEHLKIINMLTDELESQINESMDNKKLLHLFTLGKSLVYYVNSINSNSLLVEKLKYNATKLGFTPEEIEFVDDLMIENTQCLKQAEIYSNILASLMDARASIVGNNLNVLMKTLNIIIIIIMVPTFVVSAFSMNVPHPLSSNPWAFWHILGLALFSMLLIVLMWRKKKW